MITFEKATYSHVALAECVSMVKRTNWTVQHKAEHFSKCFEVQKVYDVCLQKTGCMLFEADYSAWKSYFQRVNLDFESKGKVRVSKKELDVLLRRCYLEICNELNGILTMIETGEVNSVA